MKNDIYTLLSKETRWEPIAKEKMSLVSMVGYLYEYKLIKGSKPIHPFPKTFKQLYNEKKDLLNELTTIICSTIITPSNINKDGTNESYLFIIFGALMEIELYYFLEKRKKDGYKKALNEYKKAHYLIQLYSDKEIPFDFPLHKNELLRMLEIALKEGKIKYRYELKEEKKEYHSKKIISLIKEEYDITSLTLTSREKESKSHSDFIEFLQNKDTKKEK